VQRDEKLDHEAALAFGRRLRLLMEQRGYTYKSLGDAVGVNHSTIRKMVVGQNVGQYLHLKSISQALGTTPNTMLGMGDDVGDSRLLIAAVQGVIEQLGHDRETAMMAAQIALAAAQEQRVLDEDAATEVRVSAKLALKKAALPKSR
jgi:transcriptional regulator with XRE-family HTH domain